MKSNWDNDSVFLVKTTIGLFKNGGEISDLHRNYPLRGGKTTVFEGGQRVRSFIYGKDLDIKPFVYNGMFHFVDWLPTIMSAAMDTPISSLILIYK